MELLSELFSLQQDLFDDFLELFAFELALLGVVAFEYFLKTDLA
jgi:hypothetical protein